MIVMLVKLQVEHKGRLRVFRWEIEIAGGAVQVTRRRPQQHTTPCDFLLGPPCCLDQTAGRHASTPASTLLTTKVAAAAATCLHWLVLAQVGKSFICRSTSSVLLCVLSC
jgi:hypothetical protein